MGCNYGSLVYQFLMNALNARGVYEEGVRTVFREKFYTPEIRLAKELSSSIRMTRTVRLVLARFARLRFMNIPLSLCGEVASGNERPVEVRSERLNFVYMGNAWDNTNIDTVSVRVTRNICTGKELFVDYEDSYENK